MGGQWADHAQGSTLPRGTVILTGTPAGIGASKTPPVYLKAGDELRVSISHGLGTLVNPVMAEG
jgi:2-keto-4-pentenoate hydratase/2-oxohepta-3-ene-1,7-dioic acid hydratase in catechol pathway